MIMQEILYFVCFNHTMLMQDIDVYRNLLTRNLYSIGFNSKGAPVSKAQSQIEGGPSLDPS
jgi:hypothetical protein